MAELLEALIRGFVALLLLIGEVLALLAEVAVTLIAYLWSQGFRERKEAEWQGRRARKFAHLALSGVCLLALIAIPAWLALRKPGSVPEARKLEVETAERGEELRLRLNITNEAGATNETRIAIKEGGMLKIVGSRTRKELAEQIKSNVVKIDDQDKKKHQGPVQTDL